METIIKGRLGYNIVEKQLLLREYHLYVPLLEDTKVDLIAEKNNLYYKIQIKIVSEKEKIIPVRKISHNQGDYKVFHYTRKDIDFFFGVDLSTEDIYVLPIDFVEKYSSCIALSKIQMYKNNFSLMEPDMGNLISGEDNIGERLTANAEGSKNARRE